MGSTHNASNKGKLVNGPSCQPYEDGITVSGGLILTSHGGEHFSAGFSTDVELDARGEVIAKKVDMPLVPSDNGKVIQSDRRPRKQENPIGHVHIQINGKAKNDPDPEFQIFVRNLDGKTHTFRIRASDSVCSLKQQIREKIGMPPDQQRLVYAGHNVEEGFPLSKYKIKPEATLYLQGRLRGGNTGPTYYENYCSDGMV